MINNRRKYTALVMAVLLSTLGLAIEGQSQERGPMKKALEGSWRVTARPGPNRPPFVPETIEVLATYGASGGYVVTDSLEPASGHGSWEFTGHGRFNATHEKFLFDPQRQLIAILHVRSKITLNFDNDEYTSEELVEIRQFPSGAVLFAYAGATALGRRISVEPID
jgi:hypothetical protein